MESGFIAKVTVQVIKLAPFTAPIIIAIMKGAIAIVGCLILQTCLSQQRPSTADIGSTIKNRIEVAKTLTNSQIEFNQAASDYLAKLNAESAALTVDGLKTAMDTYIELEKKKFNGFTQLLGQGLEIFKENAKQIPSATMQDAVETGTNFALNGLEKVSKTTNDKLDRYRAMEDNRMDLSKAILSDVYNGAADIRSTVGQVATKANEMFANVAEQKVGEAENRMSSFVNEAVRQATQQMKMAGGSASAQRTSSQQVNQIRTPTVATTTTTTATAATVPRRG